MPCPSVLPAFFGSQSGSKRVTFSRELGQKVDSTVLPPTATTMMSSPSPTKRYLPDAGGANEPS